MIENINLKLSESYGPITDEEAIERFLAHFQTVYTNVLFQVVGDRYGFVLLRQEPEPGKEIGDAGVFSARPLFLRADEFAEVLGRSPETAMLDQEFLRLSFEAMKPLAIVSLTRRHYGLALYYESVRGRGARCEHVVFQIEDKSAVIARREPATFQDGTVVDKVVDLLEPPDADSPLRSFFQVESIDLDRTTIGDVLRTVREHVSGMRSDVRSEPPAPPTTTADDHGEENAADEAEAAQESADAPAPSAPAEPSTADDGIFF